MEKLVNKENKQLDWLIICDMIDKAEDLYLDFLKRLSFKALWVIFSSVIQ